MRRLLILALMVLPLSGCVEQQAHSEAEHRFGGHFKSTATQADIEDFGRRMRAHGGEAIIMESFPAQFRVADFGHTGCAAARDEAMGLAYVASVNACVPMHGGSGPASATSTSAA